MREHCRYGMEEVLRRMEATLNQGDARAQSFTRAITLQAKHSEKAKAKIKK